MTRTNEKSLISPVHPGGFVRVTIIEPLGLSVKEAAQALGIHRVALSRFLNEQAALSPEMAIRLQKAFGADFEELMRMQNDYDIQQAKLRYDGITVTSIIKNSTHKEQQLPLAFPKKGKAPKHTSPDTRIEKNN